MNRFVNKFTIFKIIYKTAKYLKIVWQNENGRNKLILQYWWLSYADEMCNWATTLVKFLRGNLWIVIRYSIGFKINVI
jgi:hypothetical protein